MLYCFIMRRFKIKFSSSYSYSYSYNVRINMTYNELLLLLLLLLISLSKLCIMDISALSKTLLFFWLTKNEIERIEKL
jgi:hypothetical protein